MAHVCHFFGIVFVFEQNGKSNRNNQGIRSKSQPDTMPIPYTTVSKKSIYYLTADDSAKESAKTIGHHHEQSLGTGTNLGIGSGFDK